MTSKIWLLYLILPGRYRHITTALVLFSIIISTFLLGIEVKDLPSSSALFFAAIIAYIIPVFSYISRISIDAVNELRPVLQLSDEAFNDFLHSIDHKSSHWNLLAIAIGIIAGLFHIFLMEIIPLGVFQGQPVESDSIVGAIGALIVWPVMNTAVWALLANTVRIGRLAAQLKPVELFRTDRLAPFARVGVASSLSIIGSTALFPLLIIDDAASLFSALPGLVTTAPTILMMLLFSIWPAHTAIKRTKLAAIEQINLEIDNRAQTQTTQGLQAMNVLLDYRSHLRHVSDWPLDISNISRFALYLLIPPLTWVGAALIENLVDAAL